MTSIRSAPLAGVLAATLVVLGLVSTFLTAGRHRNEFDSDVYASPVRLLTPGGR